MNLLSYDLCIYTPEMLDTSMEYLVVDELLTKLFKVGIDCQDYALAIRTRLKDNLLRCFATQAKLQQ